MPSEHTAFPTATEVQRFVLQRLQDAGRPMVLLGGGKVTQLAQFGRAKEWGLLTRLTVIETLLTRGYIERVSAYRCQITPQGTDLLTRRHDPVPRRRGSDSDPVMLPHGPGDPMALDEIHWFTTVPRPGVQATVVDAGQRGWRVHAVAAPRDATPAQIEGLAAACGIRPRHGWEIDPSVEERCARCERALGTRR